MCYIEINDSKIEWYLRWNHKTEKSWDMRNPLIFKTFPKSDDIEGNQYMVYDRHNKSDRLRLQITRKMERNSQILTFVNIFVEKRSLPDIAFIRDMNESLFKQIDSMIDYHSESGLSGHMLWFNTETKYYYCFQPEGQQLSEQVFYKMNNIIIKNSKLENLIFIMYSIQCSSEEKLKMAFEECKDIMEEETEESIPTEETENEIFWIIVSIIVITVVLITVIVGVIQLNNSWVKWTLQGHLVYPNG